MKIIKPSAEFYGAIPTEYGSALKFIEIAGRTCYKSEDKITETSAEGFVKKLIKAGHLAMVEHSNFVVKFESPYVVVVNCLGKYLNSVVKENHTYVGGSLTAWYQQVVECTFYPELFQPFLNLYRGLFDTDWDRDSLSLWQPCPHNEIPQELHRYSAKFICDRGVSHELVRHRPCSFAQESTRYVNYGGKDMEFIEPAGFEDWSCPNRNNFKEACERAQFYYNCMLHQNALKPQQARAVLPNALKTEIIVTTDAAEWAHIRKLRTHPSAHPDMVRVMNMMTWDFIDNK